MANKSLYDNLIEDLQWEKYKLAKKQLEDQREQLDNQRDLNNSQAYTEEEVLRKLRGISPNEIANHHVLMADFFNIVDMISFNHIIENAQKGNLDLKALQNLIPTQKGQEKFKQIVTQLGPNVDLVSLSSAVSNSIKNMSDQRTKLVSESLDNAKKDIDVRVEGVNKKMDALDQIRQKSLTSQDVYGQAQRELDGAISDIEKFKNERKQQLQRDEELRKLQEEEALRRMTQNGLNDNPTFGARK